MPASVERLDSEALVSALLRTGEEWAPIADSEPSGPFFGVLAAGATSLARTWREGERVGFTTGPVVPAPNLWGRYLV